MILVVFFIAVLFLVGWLTGVQVMYGALKHRIDREFLQLNLMINDIADRVKEIEETEKAIQGAHSVTYDPDFMKKCIDEVKSGFSIRAVSRDHGVPYSTLKAWVDKSKKV